MYIICSLDIGRSTEYAKGSLVLKHYCHNTASRKSNKQASHRTGPYEVLSSVDQTLALQDPANTKIIPIKAHLLRENEYDPMHTDFCKSLSRTWRVCL